MNVENIAGTAATGVLVFLGVVVAPHLSGWGLATSSLVALAAVVVAFAGAASLGRLAPAAASASHFAYDAAWDQALSELTPSDVA